MGEKDKTEKTLESFNNVFADIVNVLLFNGEQIILEDSLSDAQPFSVFKNDGMIHAQERDVSKYWLHNSKERLNIRIAFFGIENQTDYDKDMPLRVISYDGAAYKAQLDQKNRYPVLTLVLHFGNARWGRNKTLFQSDFKIVADYFVNKRTNPDYRPENPERIKHVDELLKLLSSMTKDKRFEETLNWEGKKPRDMCEVLDRVEARGFAKGEAMGLAKGEASVTKLVAILLSENRLDDIKRITVDKDYLKKLCMEYSL